VPTWQTLLTLASSVDHVRVCSIYEHDSVTNFHGK
jgi:hypothetical protein